MPRLRVQGLRSNSGNLATFTAMRRRSSLLSNLAAPKSAGAPPHSLTFNSRSREREASDKPIAVPYRVGWLVMPKVHFRSTYWSHATRRRPARSWRKTGRHANQRCQFMTDVGEARGLTDFPTSSGAMSRTNCASERNERTDLLDFRASDNNKWQIVHGWLRDWVED
jgi:hypothetical protein